MVLLLQPPTKTLSFGEGRLQAGEGLRASVPPISQTKSAHEGRFLRVGLTAYMVNGRYRTRTYNLLDVNETLCQLS